MKVWTFRSDEKWALCNLVHTKQNRTFTCPFQCNCNNIIVHIEETVGTKSNVYSTWQPNTIIKVYTHRTVWYRNTSVFHISLLDVWSGASIPLILLSLQLASPVHYLSQDAPHLLKSRTHLGTGQCCWEGVVTDGHSLLCVVNINLIKTRDSNKRHKYSILHCELWNIHHLKPSLTAPWANAPITTAAGPSGTNVRGQTASPAEKEVQMRGQPGGRWSDTGFLIILSSFWGPSAALTLSLCSSWTK